MEFHPFKDLHSSIYYVHISNLFFMCRWYSCGENFFKMLEAGKVFLGVLIKISSCHHVKYCLQFGLWAGSLRVGVKSVLSA